MNRPTPAHPLLDRLWDRYVVDVPYASTFAKLNSGAFENDHIALRSFALGSSGIDSFVRVFAPLGWKKAGEYSFPDVHLDAIHMSQDGLPRIFISELNVSKLSPGAQTIVAKYADAQPRGDDFVPPSRLPTSAELDVVAKESQYGAWVLAFGRKVNHFTASVDDVEAWQRRLIDAGVPMKSEIEGERGGDLRQTATHAAPLDVTLSDGVTRSLPYAYVEIAQRRAPFDGFLAPQARQLFDMTARG